MMKHLLFATLALFTTPFAAAAATCEDLAKLSLPNTTITMAQSVAAGPRTVRGVGGNQVVEVPAFCLVAATAKPAADSDIKIEVWLPAGGWNGKLHSSAPGGWTGLG